MLIGLKLPLVALEATLSLDASEAYHPVRCGFCRRVTLREFLGRITRPVALEALPFAQTLRPSQLCFLLAGHDRPPGVRVGRFYGAPGHFRRHFAGLLSQALGRDTVQPSHTPVRVEVAEAAHLGGTGQTETLMSRTVHGAEHRIVDSPAPALDRAACGTESAGQNPESPRVEYTIVRHGVSWS